VNKKQDVEPSKKVTIMKKMMFTLVVMMTIVTSATAMNGKQARMEALKATDYMAMQLGLSKYQYDKVYEINVSYFRHLDGRHDGRDMEVRNHALARVLTAQQMHKLNGHRASSNYGGAHKHYSQRAHGSKGWRR
jgi:hypothetical protein